MAQPTSITLETPVFDQARAEAAVRELLLAVGEDPERQGLQDTPARVARAFREMFAGLDTDPDVVLETTFDEQHDELVLVKQIPMYSTCEHHLVAFHGVAHVGYIPGEDGLGHRAVEAGPGGRPVCQAPAGAGAPDRTDRRCGDAQAQAPRRHRRHRGHRAPVHGDARSPQTPAPPPRRRRCVDSSRPTMHRVTRRWNSISAQVNALSPMAGTCVQVMGVVNVTDDSFSDGGRYLDPVLAVEQGIRLAAQGAAIVDVGGESTRPGAVRVDAAVETARVLPVAKELAAQGITVSIDTMHAAVAAAALENGASIVNDVSGGRADPAMAPLLAAAKVPWVMMHWRFVGADQPHDVPDYRDVVAEVREELARRSRRRGRRRGGPGQPEHRPGPRVRQDRPTQLGPAACTAGVRGHRYPGVVGLAQALPRHPARRRRRHAASTGRPGDRYRGGLGAGCAGRRVGS